MKSPDVVFRELGQLYDFYREIAKFRVVDKEKPSASPTRDPQPAPASPPRIPLPDPHQ
jgi:hypothetical protein